MERLTKVGGDGHTYCARSLGCYDGCQRILHRLAAYEDALPLERAQELGAADKEGRFIILPAPIGGRVFVTCEFEETTGEIVREVEETGLAGYINEDGRPFYLCYDESYGSCDVPMENLFFTRAEAEAALRKEHN